MPVIKISISALNFIRCHYNPGWYRRKFLDSRMPWTNCVEVESLKIPHTFSDKLSLSIRNVFFRNAFFFFGKNQVSYYQRNSLHKKMKFSVSASIAKLKKSARSNILKQICSWKLQVCLSVYVLADLSVSTKKTLNRKLHFSVY